METLCTMVWIKINEILLYKSPSLITLHLLNANKIDKLHMAFRFSKYKFPLEADLTRTPGRGNVYLSTHGHAL